MSRQSPHKPVHTTETTINVYIDSFNGGKSYKVAQAQEKTVVNEYQSELFKRDNKK